MPKSKRDNRDIPTKVTVTPGRLRWLEAELGRWREDGLIDQSTAERIAAGYGAGTRPQVVRMMLFVGAALVGVGVIWLVAANVDIRQVGPLARFAGVAALWVGFVVAGEVVSGGWRGRFGGLAEPLRMLALLAYGGAIFQAAQSLQVPAYEPSLLLAWSLGGLGYAYATRAAAALTVVIATIVGWYVWTLLDGGDGPAVLLGLALAAPVAAGAAALHDGGSLARFAGPWRFAAAVLALAAMFAAAVPSVAHGRTGSSLPIVLGALAGTAIGAVAIARNGRRAVPEVAGALAVALALGLLIVVAPDTYVEPFSSRAPETAQTLYTLLAAALFLAASVGVAVVGIGRGARRLTDLAFAFLLLFVAVQSFGTLASILSGAGLVLAAGAVMLTVGILLDRGRRRLIKDLAR